MKKGKYQKVRPVRRSGTKLVALTLAMVLLIGGVVGGTLAWLTDKTDEVTNVFTTSDIDITLTETKENFKMIPGWTIDKDPIVTVEAGSEDAWVFIKVEGTGVSFTPEGDIMPQVYSLNDYLCYEIDGNNWKPLDGEPGVYYTKYANRDDVNISIKVLGEGTYTDPMGTADTSDDVTVSWGPQQVCVKPSVTEEMMEKVTSDNQPTLTFAAYAVQLYKTNGVEFTAAEAWALVNK